MPAPIVAICKLLIAQCTDDDVSGSHNSTNVSNERQLARPLTPMQVQTACEVLFNCFIVDAIVMPEVFGVHTDVLLTNSSIVPRANLSVVAKLVHRVAGGHSDGLSVHMDAYVAQTYPLVQQFVHDALFPVSQNSVTSDHTSKPLFPSIASLHMRPVVMRPSQVYTLTSMIYNYHLQQQDLRSIDQQHMQDQYIMSDSQSQEFVEMNLAAHFHS